MLRYRTEVTNGDGTVPLHSADLRDRARGIDLSGQVITYYFNLEHGELPKDPNVLALANAIFAGAGAAQVERLAPALDARTTFTKF